MVKLLSLAIWNGTKLTFSLNLLEKGTQQAIDAGDQRSRYWIWPSYTSVSKRATASPTWLSWSIWPTFWVPVENHGAWTNVTAVVLTGKAQAEALNEFWWWASSHLASFIRCIASCNASWWRILSTHWPSLRFTWRLSRWMLKTWKWLWNVPFILGR